MVPDLKVRLGELTRAQREQRFKELRERLNLADEPRQLSLDKRPPEADITEFEEYKLLRDMIVRDETS